MTTKLNTMLRNTSESRLKMFRRSSKSYNTANLTSAKPAKLRNLSASNSAYSFGETIDLFLASPKSWLPSLSKPCGKA